MKHLLILLLTPALLLAAPIQGGKVSPDSKVELTCDLARSQKMKNVGGSDGAGLCVFTSICWAGRYQQIKELYDFQDKMRHEKGGGWPEKVDAMMKKYAPGVKYIQDTTGSPEILKAILKSGRIACVTYNGHDSHYGPNTTIAHMICCMGFTVEGTDWVVVSDNNFIEDNQFMWMTQAEFMQRYGSSQGWCVCLLAPPPPPIPHN